MDSWLSGSTVCLEDVILLRVSPKAILVSYRDSQQWIPKSQIHPDWGIPNEKGASYLVISRWIAEKKGWGYNVG